MDQQDRRQSGAMSEHTDASRRLDRLRSATIGDLAGRAGLNRDTVSAVLRGGGSRTSRRRVDDALTEMEAEAGLPPWSDQEPAEAPRQPAAEPIRVTFHEVFGIGEIIIEGPADKPDDLVEAIGKLLDEVRRREG